MDINEDYSGIMLGKYQLLSKLGNGGFGAVYKVYDSVLKTEKALKILQVNRPEEAEKIFQEASIPYKCQHRNIIKIYGGELIPIIINSTKTRELLFVIDMELVDGVSVEKLLQTDFLSLTQSLNIIKDILFGLEHSHNEGIIHRDIKPGNILIDKGIPKLSDFGLASTLGTMIEPPKWYLPHCAPEAMLNNIATVETDIFAMGITFFRMVNNIKDWSNYLQTLYSDINELENDIISGTFIKKLQYRPYVPEKVKRIIKKACAFNPAERYSSASEMRNAIAKLHTNIEWHQTSDIQWYGNEKNGKLKEILIESKKNKYKVIIKNNGRISSKESKEFTTFEDSKNYMNEFIKESLL